MLAHHNRDPSRAAHPWPPDRAFGGHGKRHVGVERPAGARKNVLQVKMVFLRELTDNTAMVCATGLRIGPGVSFGHYLPSQAISPLTMVLGVLITSVYSRLNSFNADRKHIFWVAQYPTLRVIVNRRRSELEPRRAVIEPQPTRIAANYRLFSQCHRSGGTSSSSSRAWQRQGFQDRGHQEPFSFSPESARP